MTAGTIPPTIVNFGSIIEAENGLNTIIDFDFKGPVHTALKRATAFIESVGPMIKAFPALIGSAKAALLFHTRIKRLEATLKLVHKLVADRKRGTSAIDDLLAHEERCRLIHTETTAALLGERPALNTVTVIGQRAYLNVPLSEAKERFYKSTGIEPTKSMISEFSFLDEFTEALS